MRFSRPELPKLNLDLVHFKGGGSCPSRFEGITQDGRSIYARYRNGWLEIAYENPDEALLDAQIGDIYDGDMLLEQVCDLAGITIQGEMPLLTRDALMGAMNDAPVKDWSGRTSYWSFHLEYTLSAGQLFLTELADMLPGTLVTWEYLGKSHNPSSRNIVRTIPDTGDLGGVYYIGAERSDSVVLRHLLGQFDRSSDRSHRINLRMPTDARSRDFNRYNSDFASKHCGREVHVHPTFRGWISGEIRSSSIEEQQLLAGIEALVTRHFSNRRKSIDLDTGEVTSNFESRQWYSRDLIDWCNPKKMRFLGATMDKAASMRPIGYLPDA